MRVLSAIARLAMQILAVDADSQCESEGGHGGGAAFPRGSVQIGYVLKMFPRLSETFILNEISELEAQGLSLRICSLKRPVEPTAPGDGPAVRAPIIYLPERLYQQPLRVLRANWAVFCSHPRSYWHTLRHVIKGREYASLKKRLRRFCQACCLIREMAGVHHLHAHFATDPARLAAWAQRICNISFSVTTHAKDLYQGDRIASPYLQQKLSLARFVVANSEHTACLLRTALKGGAPVYTIHNGIDLSAFPLRQAEPAEPLILSIGRLVEKKGFRELLRACQILNDRRVHFRCEIVGSGALENALAALIKDYGLAQKVTLLKSMPQARLRAHYMNAMVFALPCIVADDGDRDVLPNVLKEAMAVGVPVVTTSMAAMEELIVHDETGLLVPSGDVKALAQSLELLLNDGAARRRLALNARKVIEERFDRRKNFTQLKNLLLQAVEERNRTGAKPSGTR